MILKIYIGKYWWSETLSRNGKKGYGTIEGSDAITAEARGLVGTRGDTQR